MNPLFFQFFEILVRTTYRTEKKSVPVRIFSYQNPYHVPYQVRVRTKIRTTYRTEKTVPKIRSTYRTIKSRTKNPYHVPKSVPVRPSMFMIYEVDHLAESRNHASLAMRNAPVAMALLTRLTLLKIDSLIE